MEKINVLYDGLEVLASQTLLVKEGRETVITLDPDDPLILRITFKMDPEKGEKPSFETTGEGNEGYVTFWNWKSPLGAALSEHVEIGTDDKGRRVYMNAAVWKIGMIYQLNIQFMREVKL